MSGFPAGPAGDDRLDGNRAWCHVAYGLHALSAAGGVLGAAGSATLNALSSSQLGELAETLVIGSSRPVLIVPRYGRFDSVGQRVLVAWNNTREAARTLGDAIPLMSGAQSVTLLEVNAENSAFDKRGRVDVVQHLGRHKIKAKVVTDAITGAGWVVLPSSPEEFKRRVQEELSLHKSLLEGS